MSKSTLRLGPCVNLWNRFGSHLSKAPLLKALSSVFQDLLMLAFFWSDFGLSVTGLSARRRCFSADS